MKRAEPRGKKREAGPGKCWRLQFGLQGAGGVGTGDGMEAPASPPLPPSAPNVCELNCLAEGHAFYHSFGRVLDGTPCTPGAQGLCVAGRCLVRTH